jgi:hypothetical protein
LAALQRNGPGCQGGSPRTDFPTLLEHDYHEGRAILLPNRSDQNVWRQGHPDFSAVLINSVRHLVGGSPLVTSSSPGLVRITVSRAAEPGRYLVHLVNVAGSSRRPLTHSVVLKDVEVIVGLDASSSGEVTVLYGDEAISVVASSDSRRLRIRVPRLADYACVTLG